MSGPTISKARGKVEVVVIVASDLVETDAVEEKSRSCSDDSPGDEGSSSIDRGFDWRKGRSVAMFLDC